jgi:hypothetical protein
MVLLLLLPRPSYLEVLTPGIVTKLESLDARSRTKRPTISLTLRSLGLHDRLRKAYHVDHSDNVPNAFVSPVALPAVGRNVRSKKQNSSGIWGIVRHYMLR